ncbi:dnaJ homolog subfamily C member 25 homolog [Hetaerina americana]|uniref:dnaJ homolog subfamily C member 25 homolog n=1 Tax=Hetaerina americana TaxID=62018 RepID=UPI003A7F59E0
MLLKFLRVNCLLIMFTGSALCAETYLEGLYCGKFSCYGVLEVERDAPKSQISKSYRRLAKKNHPDMHKGAEAKKEAEEKFKLIATAYEILKDEESRADYDYMLDNPERIYSHYYRYYRRHVTPKVDVRIVVAVTITIISAVQYFSACQRYESAIKYLLTVPKYRLKALDMAKKEGKFDANRKSRRRSKNEMKEEEEMIIRQVLEDNIDIRGGYAKPKVTDVLWIQLVLLPVSVVLYIAWYLRWFWKFNIKKMEYGREEKLYLIRKRLKMTQNAFDALEEEKKESYLRQELWIEDNYQEWFKKLEEDMKKQLAENSRYKSCRRYMKNHGTGRITFDDS